MAVKQVTVGVTGLNDVFPQVVYIQTSDTVAEVTTAGYLNNAQTQYGKPFQNGQMALVSTQTSSSAHPDVSWYEVSVSGSNVSLVSPAGAGSVAVPTVTNQITYATNTTGGLAAAGDNVGVFNAATTSSATPGTIRSIKGLMTGTATTMTSGNLVGVRGEVDYKSASGGFVYGVQGKVIPTGTLSGSSWNAGVFGQLDISGATINAGQIAPIWGDYGATAGTLTSETGCYGIAMTNTTAVVTIGQIYLYGGATNLLYLNTNAGLSGTTYFKAAGTSSGSAGYASGCNATEVLTISVNGTTYYLPCFAQNS